jgi:hypothetical protein
MCVLPGAVELWASPIPGVIDLGGYPQGSSEAADRVAGALRSVGFIAEVRDDIMSYKRGKLIHNLANVIEALCAVTEEEMHIERRARDEAIACFNAGGLRYTIDARPFVTLKPIAGATRPGGSTWQSLRRGKSLEVAFLNGEIVALGRAHNVATPVNAALQRLAAKWWSVARNPAVYREQNLRQRCCAVVSTLSLRRAERSPWPRPGLLQRRTVARNTDTADIVADVSLCLAVAHSIMIVESAYQGRDPGRLPLANSRSQSCPRSL